MELSASIPPQALPEVSHQEFALWCWFGVFWGGSIPGSNGKAALQDETKQIKTVVIIFWEEPGDGSSNSISFIPLRYSGW